VRVCISFFSFSDIPIGGEHDRCPRKLEQGLRGVGAGFGVVPA